MHVRSVFLSHKKSGQVSHSNNTHNSCNIPTYHCRTDSFKNSFNNFFFPWTVHEWKKLNLGICKSTHSVFRQYLVKLIRPQPSAPFNVRNFAGLHLLTRLWLGLSHLNEHRFNHNFQNCINPFSELY